MMDTGKLSRRDFGVGNRNQAFDREASAFNAFVLDPTHVDAILSVALHGPAGFDSRVFPGWDRPDVGDMVRRPHEKLSAENATEVGVRLLAGCVASVLHQQHAVSEGRQAGPSRLPAPEAYEFEDLGPILTTAECCKALACLECQSCEDPDWPDSPSRGFCGALLWRLISTLPGYREAPWELSAHTLLTRTSAEAA
jgi:hypothetical protein